MASTMPHRAPHGVGVWHEDAVGLIHLARWDTPESVGETQPYAHAGQVITAGARLDNRDDLLAQLRLSDRPARTLPDSALILAAYARWGTDCPRYLIGDFAFAIWDSSARRLFAARDTEGVCTFFYHVTPQRFAFASEIKALLALPDVPRRPNRATLAAYLGVQLPGPAERAATFYEAIFRLPPAHWMCLEDGRMQMAQYWTAQDVPDVRFSAENDYIEAYRALFEEAVRCRLRRTGPVGAHLSGGLDSSSVVCMARHLLPPDSPLRTYYALSDDPARDERKYVQAVTALFGPNRPLVHQDVPDPAPFGTYPAILRAQDGPPHGNNPAILWNLMARMQADGVSVLLDGEDGDGTVSHGKGYLGELAFAGSWSVFAQEAQAWANRHARDSGQTALLAGPALGRLLVRGQWVAAWRATGQIGRTLAIPRRHLAGEALKAFVPYRLRAWRSARQEWRTARRALGEVLRDWLPPPAPADPPPFTERANHLRLLGLPTRAIAIEELALNAAAWGLDLRHPFTDRRLVAFCVGLPGALKLRDGFGRSIARRAMDGILPPEVQWRAGKADFASSALRSTAATARPQWQAAIREPHGPLAGWIASDYLAALDAAFSSDHAGWNRQRQHAFVTLRRVLAVARWLESGPFGG